MAAAIDVTHGETSQPESATTLRTIVELVRRITHADVTSIVSFSPVDHTITWKAASGFRTQKFDEAHPLVRPLTNKLAVRAFSADTTLTLEGIGVNPELPASDFPVHSAEGMRDLAFTPLRWGGETLGALVAAYRSAHHFTDDEKQLLEDLAGLAAIALENARLLEKVAAAERIWEQTFEAIGEGILAYDESGRILRCNARAAEMLDLTADEVVNLDFEEAFTRMFGQAAAAYHLDDARNLFSGFEVQSESGRRYLISIASISRPSKSAVNVATWRDVTQLSEMQEQLSRSRRLGSMGQLAAGVAHEINNPLAAISTCAEAVLRDVRRSEDLQALATEHQWTYYMEEIMRQAQRCKEITRGLLDLTQQRHAKRSLCDLNLIARECVKVVVSRHESATSEFKVVLDEKVRQVATDATMVRQILDNLLNNAAAAIPEQGGQVTVTVARETDRVLVEVADNGSGIPARLLPTIFDPFVTTKGSVGGYGLGLAISAALAEALGASLTVESKESEGSKFRLWLPRRAPEIA